MQEVKIEYVPYVGLIHDYKFVKTKCQNDGKLYFFEFEDGVISSNDFLDSSVDELASGKIEGVKLLGYVKLLGVNDGRE